jgi:hypothetical protein
LSRERSRICAYTDDDPPLVVQDPNLPSPPTLKLSHAENAAPNRIEIGGLVALSPQPSAVTGD